MLDKIAGITKPMPFIKWAGGKKNLLPELVRHTPSRFCSYWEPFLGGGAFFYELSTRKLIEGFAFLTDINPKLISTYRWVVCDHNRLCEKLIAHKKNHCPEYYYRIRNQIPVPNSIDEAAQFIYLNKTCFNGLYRENKDGRFNVPIGDYNNPSIFTECNIDLCHLALKDQSIYCCEYNQIHPRGGDFVYLDPPYYGKKTSFTSYTKQGFGEKEHIELRDFCDELNSDQVFFMLSNSDTEFTRELYKDYNIITVTAPRSINSSGSGRGKVSEILVKNY